jgi:hypothetical protein
MPMAPFQHIDYGNRISAIRQVAIALTQPTFNIPSQSASPDDLTCLFWINRMRASLTLGRLPSLDYTGFQAALNILVAEVP